MKKAIIIVTSVVLALLVAFGVFIYWCFRTREFISHDIEKYETLIKHFDFLPSLEDLGEYEDVYYKYFERQLGALFESHAHTLRVVYNEDEFIKQKNIIEENYSFRETVKDLRGDDLVERKTSFTKVLKIVNTFLGENKCMQTVLVLPSNMLDDVPEKHYERIRFLAIQNSDMVSALRNYFA